MMKNGLVIIGILTSITIFILVINKESNSGSASVREYVSVTCEKGDITLSLASKNRFIIILRYWDATSNSHTGENRITGKWIMNGNNLVLKAPKFQVTYKPGKNTFTIGANTITVDGYTWISSTKKTPFDSYTLVEKTKIDKFLPDATKK